MKEKFIGLYRMHITRDGSEALLDWLENKSDFFTAPASTRFHLAKEGGLVEHSINVFERLVSITNGIVDTDFRQETITLCSLLHDVCKANFYAVEHRNAKDENGVWQKVPYYTVKDQLPYGHGEKSVYIISGFMRLSRAEAMAIRWHMGGFDDSVKGGSYALSEALERFPLALYLHTADMWATYLDEKQSRQEVPK